MMHPRVIERELSSLPPTDLARDSEGPVLHPVDEICLSPVPAEIAEPPSVHPKFGTPTTIWTYRNPDGEVLGHILRFDLPGERKQFLPLTAWSNSFRVARWRWRSWPAPRPLYGLDLLADNQTATVVITEGEKAAGKRGSSDLQELRRGHFARWGPSGL